jgi:flagellar protein FliS
MFTSVSMRSANAYKTIGVETSVSGATPHQLVSLLFDALQQSLVSARSAIMTGDIATKGKSIGRAVRLLEEGLKAGLDVPRGGELATNLRNLYDYCILKLTEANLRSDVAMVDEVIRLIRPVAEGWREIRADAAVQAYHS